MDMTNEQYMARSRANDANAITKAKSKDLKKIALSMEKHIYIRKCKPEIAEELIKKCLKSGFLKETKTGYVLTPKAKETLEFMKRPLM